MTSVFLSPHNDDEALFGAFTLLRHRPLVVICMYDGEQRAQESRDACAILGCRTEQWPFGNSDWGKIADNIKSIDAPVYAPAYADGGNPDHNRVAEMACPDSVRYLTYTTEGKQTDGVEVVYEPEWIGLKLQALACYRSQFPQPGRAEHFFRGLREYTSTP